MEEPAPYTDGTGAAAGGGNCRFAESPSQDQRLQVQRLRNPEVRGSLQTPQNRPHGHQSPELPEGYGECLSLLPVALINALTKNSWGRKGLFRLTGYSLSLRGVRPELKAELTQKPWRNANSSLCMACQASFLSFLKLINFTS